MPTYDFTCPKCGTFEQRASYDTEVVPCDCGRGASRESVYPITYKMGMGELPPRHEADEIDHLAKKELNKKGWNYDRTMTEIRKNKKVDKDGNTYIDMSKAIST